jgi:hypothetical protein
MNAGKGTSGTGTAPAPGLQTEFRLDSVQTSLRPQQRSRLPSQGTETRPSRRTVSALQLLASGPLLAISLLLALGFTSIGCTGLKQKEAQTNRPLVSSGAGFSAGRVTNATGQTFNFDIEKELNKQLRSELKSQRLLWDGPASGTHLVVNTEILDYAKGDAFSRWLTPEMGKTLLDVQCSITEAGSANEIGKVKVKRTVEMGGLFSTGQWKAIFKTVAKDIVRELKDKLHSQPTTKETH